MPAPYVQGEPLLSAFSIRLHTRDDSRLRAQAAREGRKPTDLIRDATLAYLDRADGTQTEQETN